MKPRRHILPETRRCATCGGFTLIEIVIAIVLFALCSTAIATQISSARKLDQKLQARNARIQGAEIALNQLTTDVQQTFLTRSRKTPSFFVGEDDGDLDKIAFTTFSNSPIGYNVRESNQAKIAYFVTHDKETQTLRKRISAIIDNKPEEGGTVFTVLTDVLEFNLSYFDGNDYKTTWNTQDSATGPKLPLSVKIILVVGHKDAKEKAEHFETEVAIPLSNYLTRAPSNPFQTPSAASQGQGGQPSQPGQTSPGAPKTGGP